MILHLNYLSITIVGFFFSQGCEWMEESAHLVFPPPNTCWGWLVSGYRTMAKHVGEKGEERVARIQVCGFASALQGFPCVHPCHTQKVFPNSLKSSTHFLSFTLVFNTFVPSTNKTKYLFVITFFVCVGDLGLEYVL
jgi:hypothetical protein